MKGHKHKRDWLIQKRIEAGYTQSELATKLNVSNRTISNIELGYRNPSGALACRMAFLLDFEMKRFYVDSKTA